MNEEVVKFSDVISASIERLFKAGGLSLVFIFLGFAAMVFGHFYSSTLSGYIFGVGVFLSTSVLVLFLYLQFRGAAETRKIIKDNKELLDATQEIAIGLANTISETQSLLFKHVEDVGKVLEIITNYLSQFPELEKMNLGETLNVNAVIVATTGKSKNIVDDIHKALVNGDVNELKKYSEELRKSTEALKKSLRTENKITKHIPNLKVIQDNFIKLTNSSLSIVAISIEYKKKADFILKFVAPLVKISGKNPKINGYGINEVQDLSLQVDTQLSNTKNLLSKLHESLLTGDTEAMTHILRELSQVEISANQLLEQVKDVRSP